MNSATNHLHALTGLRFFAAFAVVVHHLFGKFGLPDIKWPLGAMAVSFFFVLSGFILTYVYRDRLKAGGVKKFYYTRWARIWPLHLVCLLIAIVMVGSWSGAFRTPAMLATNFALLQSWAPDTRTVFSFNGVSWSISTEMFFYVMFPLLLLGGQRSFWIKYILICCAAIGVVFGLQYFANIPEYAERFDFERVAHVNPFLRLPEFCTGMGVGFLFFNRLESNKPQTSRPVWVDTAMETFALFLIPAYLMTFRFFTVSYQLQKTDWGGIVLATWVRFVGAVFIFAFVVHVFARSKGYLARFFGCKPIVFLGEISFALYMIHWIVILYVKRFDWSGSNLSPWVLGACVTAISLSLSVLLFKLVEVPSKSALLKVYEGEWKSALEVVVTSLKGLLSAPIGWVTGIALTISILTLTSNYRPLLDDALQKNIVATTPMIFRDANFGPHLRMMGLNASPVAEGIQLRILFRKTGKVIRGRFTHLCDAQGKILRQVPMAMDPVNAPLLEPFLETCLIPNSKLADVSRVGIGLYSKEIDPETKKPYGCIPISKGPRSMGIQRLDIISAEQMKKLKAQIRALQKSNK